MDDLYEVVDFEKRYMTPESRRYKHLPWIPIPTSHDGLAFRKIAALKNDTEVFTAWVLILQISANLKDRGVLRKDGIPLNAKDLAELSGYPVRIFTEAFNVLTEPKINWLRRLPSSHPAVTQQSPSSHPLLHEHEHKHKIVKDPPTPQGQKTDLSVGAQALTISSIPTDFVENWNRFAKEVGIRGLKTGLSESRKRGIVKNMNAEGFVLHAILDEIRQSDHLRGVDGGWQVTFDWIFCPGPKSGDNWRKILDGNYRNRGMKLSLREADHALAAKNSMKIAAALTRKRALAKEQEGGG